VLRPRLAEFLQGGAHWFENQSRWRSTSVRSFLYKRGLPLPREPIPLLNKSEDLGTSLGYILIDSVLFYVPPSVPASQPPRLSGVLAAFLPVVAPFPSFSITSNSARQTAAQHSNWNKTRKDFHMVKCVDMSDPALPKHLLKQRTCGDDLVQVQGTCRDPCHDNHI
jgi:hypothetical protein